MEKCEHFILKYQFKMDIIKKKDVKILMEELFKLGEAFRYLQFFG